jgi:hypothetical protein
VLVWRCRRCGHRQASHEREALPADYHRQYDEGAFLDALAATRHRQALRILSLLRRHLQTVSAVVDYGAGRGFLLAACQKAGIAPLAGLDTSPLAVEGLRSIGIEAHQLGADEDPGAAFSRLSFRPRVVAFLDVIEHFPPAELAARLRGAVEGARPGLEAIVIKVPVPGLLYSGARLGSLIGIDGPLRQLYQAGTWPPHFHYFSRGSLRRFLNEACELAVVESVGDPDFEAEALPGRVGVRNPWARAVARIGGRLLAAAVRGSGWSDSVILLARPIRPGR